METLLQDLRYGARMLLKKPGFTLIAVITLALGIGANTAIFSVVDAVLLKPLAFPDPDRLMVLQERNNLGLQSAAWPNFLDWRQQNQSFESLAAYRMDGYNLTGVDEAARLPGGAVSASFFSLLGASATIGRVFNPEEDRPGADPVVVLSHHTWVGRFGSDEQVIGKAITLNGVSTTVIGVLSPDFKFFRQTTDLYVPVGLLGASPVWVDRGNHPGLRVLGRLRPGASIERALADMDTIAARLEEQYPKSNSGQRVSIEPLVETQVRDVRPVLWLLLAAVGFVLLIACANVANLLLTRASSRQREIAIRTAVGARRAQLVRQLLTESVLLAVMGGGLGLLIAMWGTDKLIELAPGNIPRLHSTRIDSRVLLFTLLVSVLTGIVFGLVPALQSSKVDLNSGLKEDGRGASAGKSHKRLWSSLLTVEVALAVVLVIGSGLMIRSILCVQQVDPGFDPENVLALDLTLSGERYQRGEQRLTFYSQVLEKIRSLPGVQSTAGIMCLPIAGSCWGSVYLVEGRPVPAQSELPSSPFNIVTADYFTTMRVRLLEGRLFTDTDNDKSPPVIIINESMAQRYWANESPLGKRIKQGFPQDKVPYREIVGVVADVRQGALDSEENTEVYLPLTQDPVGDLSIVVRTASEPTALGGAIREEIRSVNTDQPVRNLRTMREYLSDSMARRRFSTLLLGLLAGLALLLAAVGVYAVMAYSVTQRTHEIGIRTALGARRRDIFKLVVGQAMLLTLIGIGVGLAAALGLTRLMSSLLFGVSPTDPLTFSGISVLLAAVALAACLIPARRATKVDPMIALRYE